MCPKCPKKGMYVMFERNPVLGRVGIYADVVRKGDRDPGNPEKPWVLEAWVIGFGERVHPEPTTGCWLWDGSVSPAGYAWIRRGGTCFLLNRLVLRHILGRPIRKGHFACHRCDTPACINPDHLYEGTPKSNSEDARRRDRFPAKMTQSQVVEMRKRYAKGELQKELAAEFGVHYTTVSKIVRGKSQMLLVGGSGPISKRWRRRKKGRLKRRRRAHSS